MKIDPREFATVDQLHDAERKAYDMLVSRASNPRDSLHRRMIEDGYDCGAEIYVSRHLRGCNDNEWESAVWELLNPEE